MDTVVAELELKPVAPGYDAEIDFVPAVVDVRLQVPVVVPPEPDSVAVQVAVPSPTVTDPVGPVVPMPRPHPR